MEMYKVKMVSKSWALLKFATKLFIKVTLLN